MPYRYKADAPDDFVAVLGYRSLDLSSAGAVSGAEFLEVDETADGAIVVRDVGGAVRVPVTVKAGDQISDADWAAWDMANQDCGVYWEEI